MPDALADATLVYGSEAECVEKLRKYESAGCSEIILEPYWVETEKRMAAVAFAGRLAKAVGH